jgi:hypothetical protein
MANKIEIQIEAGTDQLIKSLNSADKAAVKFSGTLTKSFSPIRTAANQASNAISKGFGDAFGTLTKGVALGNLVSSGILSIAGAVKNFVSGTISAAQQQEDAINKLSQALRASGSFSQAAIRDFEAFASGLQKVTRFGDEVVLGQLAIAKSFGASNDQAKQLVQAAANLSATFGGSLEDNVQKLGKTLTGTAGRLAQFIPELKALTEEQLLAGNALDIVNKKFAGAASNELNTFSGRVSQLTNAIGDFQEELGLIVTKGSASLSFIRTLTSGFEAFSSVTRNLRKDLGIGLSPLEEQRKNLKDLKVEMDNLTDAIIRTRSQAETAKFFGKLEKEQVYLAKLADLEQKRTEIIKQRTQLRSGIQESLQETEKEPRSPIVVAGKKELEERARINEAIKQQRAEFNAFEIQSRLQQDDLTAQQRIDEFDKLIEFENQKVEAVRQAEIAKAQLIKDQGARKLEIQRANEKAELESQKNTIKGNIELDRQLTQARQQEFNTRIGALNNFLQAGLALSKENSSAQKALAITQATISTYQGATNALADTRPAFLGPAVAASIVALGLANVARIAGAKFAQGGIVGGTSTQGDRVPALLNSREMVLNMGQQRELFNIANGGSRNNSEIVSAIRDLISEVKQAPIIVQANGREIARLIRDEGRNGFEVLA